MARRPSRQELFDAEFLRRLRHLALRGRRILTGASAGRHRATDLGDGLEFADHRDYSPGDELRYVDWNVLGRLDRLQVRLFHRHREQQVHLLLDNSASMALGPAGAAKDVFARRCAAGLAYLAWANLDHLSIAAWNDAASQGPASAELNPGRGRVGRFSTVLDFLANLTPAGECDLAQAARRWVARRPPRGLAVLLSDVPDPDQLADAVRRLRHGGHQVALLHVYSPQEAGAAPRGPAVLLDPERPAARVRLTVTSELRQAYRHQWEHYLARVRATVHAVAGLCAHSASDASWERFLLTCLRQLRLEAV